MNFGTFPCVSLWHVCPVVDLEPLLLAPAHCASILAAQSRYDLAWRARRRRRAEIAARMAYPNRAPVINAPRTINAARSIEIMRAPR